MNRNYSVICYIVSYILSMTCMPALATACWITDTMIQQAVANAGIHVIDNMYETI